MLNLKNESMKTWFLIIMASLLVTACAKDNEKQAAETVCLDGTIQWGGDPAADGTGWTFVSTETTKRYFLKNLPETFKRDDLQVAVCLQQTEERAYCYCSELPYLYVITSIKRND